jgi:hypothetical protein
MIAFCFSDIGVFGELRERMIWLPFSTCLCVYTTCKEEKRRGKRKKKEEKREKKGEFRIFYTFWYLLRNLSLAATRLILSTSILPIIMAKKDRSVSVSPHKGTKQKNV